ncbi:hypothetical protein FGG08_004325 [Glutinoglossum americanum]|uniref:tyrosinase n=1 Tax=Glutinoglossum americanum TaxID=1670608 RepID=A0A9P8L2T7_9PEZI|nr:hypothetical protein FGG08_004325 [Glutinoglossum americanum]
MVFCLTSLCLSPASLLELRIGFADGAGAKGGVTLNGERPDRSEFRDFQNTGEPFDLYIQALDWFQGTEQPELLSFFQVAAAEYPEGPTRTRYQAAAVTFRIPYWDWAYNATMPDLVNSPTIEVNTKNGPQTLRNPLAAYVFHPKPDASVFPTNEMVSVPSLSLTPPTHLTAPYKWWSSTAQQGSQYSQTVRRPDGNGNSQPDAINAVLNSNAGSLHDRIYLLLSRETEYSAFSNTNGQRSDTNSDSLEAVHNDIHVLVGWGGHMMYVPYSAFDPIFWLHHTNIDRLYAIWQAINPDSYVIDQVSRFNTFTTNSGSTEGVNTALAPFHGPNDIEFTSANSRHTVQFGYTYPEVRDWSKTPAEVKSDAQAAVNRLYGPAGVLTRRGSSIGDVTPPLRIPPGLISDGGYRRWFVNIRLHKFALGGPGIIHIFAGNFSNDPKEWPTDPSLVGSGTIFANPNTTSTSGGDELFVHASIPLTRKLVDAYDKELISSLDPASVTPFLAKYLDWRVTKDGYTAIDPGRVNTLKIYVGSQDVTVPASDTEFPTYGASYSHIECTNGKPGGVDYGDGS